MPPPDGIVDSLVDALTDAVDRLVAPEGQTLLFSGGLDSTVLARLLARQQAGPSATEFLTIGIMGAKDLEAARSAAAGLGIRATVRQVEEAEVLATAGEVARLLSTEDPVTVAFCVPLLLGARHAGNRVLMSGQGADELFGGYARYVKMNALERGQAMQADVEAFLRTGADRDRSLARGAGRDLRMPYIETGVLAAADRVPPERKVALDGTRKAVLREVAVAIGVPADLAARPKRAAQYGTGVQAVIERQRQGGERLSAVIHRLATLPSGI